uniref:BZIP domain-containing protein n=1 Tax=Syphacia muris TaxID=451379 RepID=A0A0N5AJY2_9BILA
MRENISAEGKMRVGGQQQISQQTLPSVSHVMGPLPGTYRSSSYVSPQSSQPATPLHSSSMTPSPLAPSPTSGPVRMVTIGQQNRSPLSMSTNMPVSGPVAFARPSDPAPLVQNPQMHVISSTQYPVVESERIQSSTNGIHQKYKIDQLTSKEKYRQLKSRFKYLVYENECYQEELRNLQRKLLKLSRDKNFLLDRLQPYEMLSNSSDESDSNSVKTVDERPKVQKK